MKAVLMSYVTFVPLPLLCALQRFDATYTWVARCYHIHWLHAAGCAVFYFFHPGSWLYRHGILGGCDGNVQYLDLKLIVHTSFQAWCGLVSAYHICAAVLFHRCRYFENFPDVRKSSICHMKMTLVDLSRQDGKLAQQRHMSLGFG